MAVKETWISPKKNTEFFTQKQLFCVKNGNQVSILEYKPRSRALKRLPVNHLIEFTMSGIKAEVCRE